MSRFRNEVVRLEAHIKTLRAGVGILLLLAVGMGIGWWSAPRQLTIHVPPDLRTGSTRPWWEVPPESVYTFGLYVWQQLHRWPTDGDEDYPRNLLALSPYFTPSCRTLLQRDYEHRRNAGELRRRVRGIYEIPGRGYGADPMLRVKTMSTTEWIVTLDTTVDEYYGAEQIKRVFMRYPLRVTRMDVDPARNPFGLAIDCYAGAPERIAEPGAPTTTGALP